MLSELPMQARIPAIGSYFTPDGKCVGTLVENTPAVQFTMDGLSNVASDGTAAQSLRYRIVAEAGGGAVAEGNITNVAEWYFQDVIRLPNLKPGKDTIEGSLVLADGKTLGPLNATIEKKDEAQAFPEWWGKKSGNLERVLPPFTAMTRHGDEVKCWGRTCTLNALGLPKAIASQQAAVLAVPARVVVVVDGREESVPMGTPTITDVKDWRVRKY